MNPAHNDPEGPDDETALPDGVTIRQALQTDAAAIHALLRPYVMQQRLLARTEAEVIELTRHGFVAVNEDEAKLVGFAAIEVYSPKLAELQCLAVIREYQGSGIGRALVGKTVSRARSLGVMEVLAISSSEDFFKECGFDYSLPDQKKALFCKLRPRPKE